MTARKSRSGSAPARSSQRNGPSVPEGALALAGAAALGSAATAWAASLARGFGQAPDTVMTLGSLAVLAVALGTFRDFRPPAGPGARAGRAAGWKLAGAGLVTFLGALVAPAVPRILVWAGAGADAPEWAVTAARAALGGLMIFPAGLLAGAAMRAGVRELPEGGVAARVLAAAGPAAAAGAAIAAVLGRGAPPLATAAAAGGALVAVGLLAAVTHRGRHVPTMDPSAEAAGHGPAVWGAGVAAFGVTAFAFLAARSLVPAFGNDLPGLPLARALFVTGLALGGLLGLVALTAARDRIPAGSGGAALLAAGLAALPSIYLRFDDLPARFAEAVRSTDAYGNVVALAVRQAAMLELPVAVLLGMAAALLMGALPEEPRARPAWLARSARAAAAGAVAGIVLPRLTLPSLGLANVLAGAAAGLAAGGALVFAASGGRRAVRTAAVVALLAAGGLTVRQLPAPERSALLVDADVVPAGALVSTIPKHWTLYDRDGVVDTVTLLRRGSLRRLLVNGRFESGGVAEIKSHGLLLHLPLAVQAAPHRVCLLGAGSGRSIAAALSHPVSEVEVLVRDGAALGALERFGPDVPPLLADERLRFVEGDLRDLLARSRPFDVIANHVSGTWTAAAAATSTREFLTLVRDRLTEHGIYTAYVPGTALTKEGFLVLLRTFADVFPQVELWAGQGGDVVVLAKRTAAPHDFRVLLESFRNPRTARALQDAWLADPVTMLSQFLVDDGAVRRLSARSVVSTARRPELASAEAERRVETFTVDPVPGLAELGGDVTQILAEAPVAELRAAMGPALRARELEREGVAAEVRANENPAAMTNARIEALDAAARIYREGLDLNPRDGALRRALASAHSSIGIAYSSKLAFTAAYSNMLRAVEIDSTYAEGFGNLGLLLADNEDFGYADATTAKALELAPDDDLLYHQRARLWKHRRFFDRALPYYEKAMEINPLNVEAAMGYSDARLSMDLHPDLEGNLEMLLALQKIEPDNPDLEYRIGRIREVMRVGIENLRPELREDEVEEETPMLLREEPDSTEAGGPPARAPEAPPGD